MDQLTGFGRAFRLTIRAWIVFFGGFGLEIAADRALRMQDGYVRTGGIPELLWFFLQIVLAIAALSLAYVATKPLRRPWLRLLALSIQAALGFLLYAAISLYYVVGTGIDSL